MSTDFKNQVKEQFHHLWKISENAYDIAFSKVNLKEVARRKTIKSMGKPEFHSRFLCQGFIGSYLYCEGEFVLKNIFQAGDVVFDETSYLSGKPSDIEIRAISRTVFFELDKEVENELLRMVPDFYPLAHRIAHSFAEKNSRNSAISKMGIEKGYHVLMEEFPGLESVITNTDLGGFFGISRRTAERFKQKLKFLKK